MDLCTLPMEMIARIAKYLDYVELVQLRKRSTLVDATAKRCGLGKRLPVKECRFDFSAAHISLFVHESIVKLYNLRQANQRYTNDEFEFEGNHWKELARILNKIKIDKFAMENSKLRKSILQTLQTYSEAIQQCTTISLYNADFACSKEEFANFLNMLSKADGIYTSCVDKNEYILNYEFLSSRKWKCVSVDKWYSFICDGLDDRVLDVIIANRTLLEIDNAVTRFTVQGVISALTVRDLSLGGKGIGYSHWGILDTIDMNNEEVVELLKAIPGIEIAWDSDKRKVKVMFESNSEMIVEVKFVDHAPVHHLI